MGCDQVIKKIYFIGFFLFALFVGPSAHAEKSDFDNVCQYFEQLDKLNDVGNMSNMQRNDFIINKIDKSLPQTSNARAAWLAIDSAVPEVRYELFKSAADSVLGKQWECSAMLKWATKTGEF